MKATVFSGGDILYSCRSILLSDLVKQRFSDHCVLMSSKVCSSSDSKPEYCFQTSYSLTTLNGDTVMPPSKLPLNTVVKAACLPQSNPALG